jgi:hypothetical protein
VARAAGLDHRDQVIENARWMARRDIHGVYRLPLKLAAPERVAIKLPRVSMQYFSFGEAAGWLVGERAMEATQRGVPEALARWMIWAVEGFAPVALASAGARGARPRQVGRRGRR